MNQQNRFSDLIPQVKTYYLFEFFSFSWININWKRSTLSVLVI